MITRHFTTTTLLSQTHSTAIFSDCETYRFRLWRQWEAQKPYLCFVMLNPSTANEEKNDPTVERCEQRARRTGYGGVQIVNLFALRSTDPQMLYVHPEPIGAENNAAILTACQKSGTVIGAWGTHGKWMERGKEIAELLRHHKIDLHALKVNADGNPSHPLYLSYGLTPTRWNP